ncbi:MAG: hypothetical protein SPL80_02425 [Bacilli bacterium]|nr:hypothetical protein [Bacilli bacterium]
MDQRLSRDILVLKSAIEEIKGQFVDFSVEKGGILLRKDDVISRFVPIPNEDPSQRSYVPSFERINEILGSLGDDLCFCGIVHNHISSSTGYGANRPSQEDKAFFASFATENKKFSPLCFPIVAWQKDGLSIAWYLFDDDLFEAEAVILE